MSQHMDALAVANQRRYAIAALRARLGERHSLGVSAVRLARLMEDPPRAVENVQVWQLLSWGWRFGPHQASRVLRRAGVNPSRRMRQLTDRQRDVIRLQLLAVAEGRAHGEIQVGHCPTCDGPVLWAHGCGASCPCGASLIPDQFFQSSAVA